LHNALSLYRNDMSEKRDTIYNPAYIDSQLAHIDSVRVSIIGDIREQSIYDNSNIFGGE